MRTAAPAPAPRFPSVGSRALRRAALSVLAVAALLPATQGMAQVVTPQAPRTVAATVSASSGDTRLMRPSALLTPVRPGEVIREGDRVVTGADGQLELRFTDGAMVTVRPASEFSVDQYRYDADGERGFFSLLRGALRTISGAIGKRNRDDYRLETPTATVGIRGTEFETVETRCKGAVCSPGDREGLTVAVIAGRVAVTNDAGTVEVPQGSTVYVRDRATPGVIAGGERPAPPRARPVQSTRAGTAQLGAGLAPELYGPPR